MFRKYAGRILLTLVFVCAVAPVLAHAVTLPTIVPSDCTNQAGGCQSICDLAQLGDNVLNDGIFAAVFLSAILFAWAGLKYVTATGNPQRVRSAKKIFFSVTVGLVLMLSAWLIVNVIVVTLTGKTTWNQLCNQTSLSAPLPIA